MDRQTVENIQSSFLHRWLNMSRPQSAFSDQQDAHDKVHALLATKSLDELKKTEVSIKYASLGSLSDWMTL